MATSREQRPQDQSQQAPTAQIAKKAPDAAAKGAEAPAPVSGGPSTEGLEPEAAASMQSTWGNEMIQSLTTGARAGTELGESEEDKATDTELEREAGTGRGNAASASGMGLTSGGPGAEVEAPWSMGRWFGGDDDAAGGAPARPVARWRPSDVPVDPDEPPPPEAAEASDEPRVDVSEARAALGAAPVPWGLLGRGLRFAERLGAPGFGPHVLARLGPQAAWSRARGGLRFLSEFGDGEVTGLALLALAGGVAGAPDAGGLSGATARALAAVEALLALTAAPAVWEATVEIAVDPSARIWVERAAAEVDPDRDFHAAALFEAARSGASGPVWFPERPHPHPAAEAALRRAGSLRPLPEVIFPDVDAPATGGAVDPFADVFRAFTGGADAAGSPFAPVYEGWNLLLAALGEVHVEAAAAALAVVGHLSAAQCHEELERLADALARATALAVAAGERAEASGVLDDHLAACEAFAAAREVAGVARAATIRQLARAVRLPEAPFAAPPPEALDAAAALPRGGVEAALPWLATLADTPGAPDTPAGVARLLSLGILAGGMLGVGRWDEAAALGRALLRDAQVERPYQLADAALTTAVALHRGGGGGAPGDAFALLAAVGRALREAGQGGALNLVVAGWAELRVREQG